MRQPQQLDRRIDFGPISYRENQENTVAIRWGTNCQDNLNAHGFYVSAQGRFLILHPIYQSDGKDLLLTCTPQGMNPGLSAARIDLSALPDFDATHVNTYRVHWVTDRDNRFPFELSVNGVLVARLPGRAYLTAPRSFLSLEFRAGDHTIDEIRWQLSQGGDPIPDRRLERARQLVTDGRRQLFLDDVMISRLDGLERKIGCPEKYKGNPVIRHHQKPWQRFRAQLYGTCLYFPEDKIFKMWYLAGPRFPWKDPVNINGLVCCPNFQLLAYAESKDGFDWELPVLGLMEFNGSRENNLCRISRENAEWVAVVYDPGDADPHRRYKAFYWEHDFCGPRKFDPATPVSGMSVSFSADGKDWTNHPHNPVINVGSDTAHQAVWDPTRKKYVVYGRLGVGQVGPAESDDFVHWSQPQRVFATDANDAHDDLFYGMGVSIYEGIYVGIPFLYHRGTTDRIDVQLATSRNGINWNRVADRQVFIPNGPEGSWDAGMVMMPSQPVQLAGDTIFIYYGGLSTQHEAPRPKEDPEFGESSIGVVTLRRDGFVFLEGGSEPGKLTTQSFEWPAGGQLHLNVDADGGQVEVAVLDQQGKPVKGWERSQPVTGDQLDVRVAWPGQQAVPRTAGPVCLQVKMKNAKLYSYWIK